MCDVPYLMNSEITVKAKLAEVLRLYKVENEKNKILKEDNII